MERNDYINIQAYMVTELGLSGNNLIIYALIHGFCKDGIHEFKGSINYICEWTNLSRNTVISILKQLVESGLLVKRSYKENNVVFCAYSLGSEKNALPVQKSDEGGAIFEPNITIENTILKNDKEKSLSKKAESDALFEKCWIAYRRKGDKKMAKVYWDKLKEDEKKIIMPHIHAYVSSREVQFQKDFERYLNKKIFLSVVFQGSLVIYDPTINDKNNNTYTPQCGGALSYNEYYKCYMYVGYWDGRHISDGYDDDNRPNGATITLNNGRGKIQWSSETKTWDKI